jgi:hypothetical protein
MTRCRAIVVIALGLTSFVWCAPAMGDVFEGAVEYKLPERAPSLTPTPEPPIGQEHLYTRSFGVRYDSWTGTLKVYHGYWEAAFWALQLTHALTETSSCPEYPDPVYCDGGSVHLGLAEQCEAAEVGMASGGEGGGSEAPWIGGAVASFGGEMRLANYRGKVSSPATLNGEGVYVWTFSNPNFEGIAAECLVFESPTLPRHKETVHLIDATTRQTTTPPPHPSVPHAKRASASLMRLLTATANARHSDGFDERHQYLTSGRVTNNGWADAEQRFRRPSAPWQRQRGIFIVFRSARGHWRPYSYGSPQSTGLCHPGKQPAIPIGVCQALKL